MCFKKKFFFNHERNSVLQFDMLSNPTAKIIWKSLKSEQFFGYPFDSFDQQTVKKLMSQRTAKLHSFFFEEHLKGYHSKKIYGISEVTIKKKSGFLERKIISVKPFLMQKCKKSGYICYLEDNPNSAQTFYSTDDFGFFNGFSKKANSIIKSEELKGVNSHYFSILFYFPELLQFFFLKSASFRNRFIELALFVPTIEIQKSPEEQDNKYFFSCNLKKPFHKNFKRFEKLISKIKMKKEKLNFVDFNAKIFRVFENTTSVLNANFSVKILSCGRTHEEFIFEILSTTDLENKSFSKDIQNSTFTNDHNLLKIVDHGTLDCRSNNSDLTKKNDFPENDNHSLTNQFKFKSNEINQRKLSLFAMDGETVPSKIIGSKISSQSSYEGDQESEHSNTDQQNYFNSNQFQSQANQNRQRMSHLECAENQQKSFGFSDLKRSSHFENNCLNSSLLDALQFNEFQLPNDDESNRALENDSVEKALTENFKYSQSNSTDLRKTSTESANYDHQKTFTEINQEKWKNAFYRKFLLISILILPILYSLILYIGAISFFATRVDTFLTSSVGAFFYANLNESGFQSVLFTKILDKFYSESLYKQFWQGVHLIQSDLMIRSNYLFNDLAISPFSPNSYIIENYSPYLYLFKQNGIAFDNLNQKTISEYVKRMDFEQLIKAYNSLSDIRQDKEQLWYVDLTFYVATIIIFGAFLAIVIFKAR